MDKKDIEKLTDVAGFLQGWLAFKKPVPNDEVVRLHFDLLMEVIAKNNESLHLVRYRFNIPDAESGFAYYDDTAYFDRDGFYMYDQDGNKKRPDEKYLVKE